MNRHKSWKSKERAAERRKKKNEWYTKGGNESVIFIPTTPKSNLRRKMQDEIRKTRLKIKVVETSGKSIKQQLQRSDPFKNNRCPSHDCLVCTSDGKGPCRRSGVTYSIECHECHSKYVGETARSAYSRGKEHIQALRNRSADSVMWRHARENHHSNVPAYTMNVTGVFSGDALLRQLTEAVQIRHSLNSINNKEEWNHLRLPGISLHNVPTVPPATTARQEEEEVPP